MRPWTRTAVRLALGVAIYLNALLRRLLRRLDGFARKAPVLRGQAPPPPQVLGIVVVGEQTSLSKAEMQAVARVVNWAVANGLTLLTVYSPHDLLTVSDVEKQLNLVDADNDVAVWCGWDAPPEWIESQKPLGVAVLGPADAETPLMLMGDASEKTYPSSLTSLERALRAPEELKRLMVEVGGPMAQLDPDMIMVFGGVTSLFGYPSWTTRSTEIYDMGSLGNVNDALLSATLQRYMLTRKRCGR